MRRMGNEKLLKEDKVVFTEVKAGLEVYMRFVQDLYSGSSALS